MLNLEKFLALIILIICILYAYTSFITMQANLLPFEKNMTVLPNSLPKVISIFGIIISTFLILKKEEHNSEESISSINLKNVFSFYYGKALSIILLMIIYTLCLRPVGFILSSVLFLFLASFILGERSYIKLAIICLLGTSIIWLLLEKVLGIYMRPFPYILQTLGS
ncbi:MAG: tripartite tricarboxylate transporter TctB family protein [Candidatus Puniceispirillales bacterium]|jgi:putative tricarboxylic transport membrane protein|tara:strand:- start:2566 stop:3066 length:501 start_codon:yes stop_codon:yes gene_type:complete